MNEKVLFEADDHSAEEGGVILRGTARMLANSRREIRDTEQSGLLIP